MIGQIRGPLMPMGIRQSDFFRSMAGQLALLGAATLVLLFFAWTYLD